MTSLIPICRGYVFGEVVAAGSSPRLCAIYCNWYTVMPHAALTSAPVETLAPARTVQAWGLTPGRMPTAETGPPYRSKSLFASVPARHPGCDYEDIDRGLQFAGLLRLGYAGLRPAVGRDCPLTSYRLGREVATRGGRRVAQP